jgi:hypothetical protein
MPKTAIEIAGSIEQRLSAIEHERQALVSAHEALATTPPARRRRRRARARTSTEASAPAPAGQDGGEAA